MILSTEYATFRDYALEDRTIAALDAAAAALLHPAGSTGRQSRLSQAHDGRLSSKSHTNLLSLGII
jgi:hypothetical protein